MDTNVSLLYFIAMTIDLTNQMELMRIKADKITYENILQMQSNIAGYPGEIIT